MGHSKVLVGTCWVQHIRNLVKVLKTHWEHNRNLMETHLEQKFYKKIQQAHTLPKRTKKINTRFIGYHAFPIIY
jgi:hypothetical protein